MTPAEAKALFPPFLEFAKTLECDEKSEAQIFLDHLFRALGHDGAKEAGATFEYRVAKKPGTSQLSLFKDDELKGLPKKTETAASPLHFWTAIASVMAVAWGRDFEQRAVFWIDHGTLWLVSCVDAAKENLGPWQQRVLSPSIR